jgi:hypothetical protein
VGSTRAIYHDLRVGPRDDMAPQPGRPAVTYALSECFAAAAPTERVEDAAWRLYRDTFGLSDSDRAGYSVSSTGARPPARVLEVIADSASDALAKYQTYNGIVGTVHEPYVAQVDDVPPARKGA